MGKVRSLFFWSCRLWLLFVPLFLCWLFVSIANTLFSYRYLKAHFFISFLSLVSTLTRVNARDVRFLKSLYGGQCHYQLAVLKINLSLFCLFVALFYFLFCRLCCTSPVFYFFVFVVFL